MLLSQQVATDVSDGSLDGGAGLWSGRGFNHMAPADATSEIKERIEREKEKSRGDSGEKNALTARSIARGVGGCEKGYGVRSTRLE